MYKCIKNFCDSDLNNGLMLLDMPTGFGKTYSVMEYIYDSSLDENNKDKKYFFITTLKKNLPLKELEQRFVENNHQTEFNEKFLFIDSNYDATINNLTPELEKKIPLDIKRTEEYKNFCNDVKFIRDSNNNTSLKQHICSIKENLRLKTEPAFRKYIQNVLFKTFSSVQDRLNAIKTDKQWQWLGKLYPNVFTRNKQIIFLSMDKFLSFNTTLVESPYAFYNSNILDNAIIFIDEFDATKETILNNLINNGLNNKIDYIEIFNQIYSALHTVKLPKELLRPSQKRLEGDYKSQDLKQVVKDIKEIADSIHDKYSLQFSHKTKYNKEKETGKFLFQDHQFMTISNDNNKYIFVETDPKSNLNYIKFSKEKPQNESNIYDLLGQLRGFINYFKTGINILSINYLQRKQEQAIDGEDEFTREAAIKSVLSEFRLNNVYKNFITSQILLDSHSRKSNIQSSEFDYSVYEKGFRYYSFEDDNSHDLQSRMMMCSFQNSPEKILIHICEKAKVIGISATATIDSVIGNYDLNYIKSKMGNTYYEISTEDKLRLKSDFEKATCNYNKTNINVKLLGYQSQEYSKKLWNNVFNNDEISECVYNLIESKLPDKKDEYCKYRYLRIALAYKEFITHKDIQSFLCVLTKHPKTNDFCLDYNILNTIFEYISKEIIGTYNPNSIMLLTGDEYDNNKDNIIKKLSKGQKLFVISAYQTIGAGQNLQYEIPKGTHDLITINDRKPGSEKDFDAIYLDKPTNILVNLTKDLESTSFVKFIYQMEFLQQIAEMSSSDTKTAIKRAFKCYITNSNEHFNHDCKSVTMLATKTIIQAIGRICRTNQKNKNIYIYADDRIVDCLDSSILDDERLLNPEFKSLLLKVQNQLKEHKSACLEEAASLLSVRVNKNILNTLRHGWDNKTIENWKMLREKVLSHPTYSQYDVDNDFVAKNLYVKLETKDNRLFYNQENDYNSIKVSFKKDNNHKFVVSSRSARLDILMTNDKLKQFFISRGWATKFESNDYIMCPPLFNNIYKGALGEVAGGYLLNDATGIKIEDIQDESLFELFDYKVKGKPIYIDFKNWNESTESSNDEMLNKIVRKAKKCKAKCVIIINAIARKEYQVKKATIEGVKILQIPYLVTYDNPNSYVPKMIDAIRSAVNNVSDTDQ